MGTSCWSVGENIRAGVRPDLHNRGRPGKASPIGRDGEFYFENVASAYPAVVEHETGRCEFTLDVPAGAGRSLSWERCAVR